jgi:hypothetical protein
LTSKSRPLSVGRFGSGLLSFLKHLLNGPKSVAAIDDSVFFWVSEKDGEDFCL